MSDNAMGKQFIGKVAGILSNTQIAINRGSDDGVELGWTATLFSLVEINDPDSHENLGSVRMPRLNFKVSLVSEKFCVATVTDYEAPSVVIGGSKGVSSTRKRKKITENMMDKTAVFVQAGHEVSLKDPPPEEEPPL